MPNKSSVRTIQLQVHWTPPVLEVEYSTCSKCGYSWQYRGNLITTKCPSCHQWVIVKPNVFESLRAERNKDKIPYKCKFCGFEGMRGRSLSAIQCGSCQRHILLRERRSTGGEPYNQNKILQHMKSHIDYPLREICEGCSLTNACAGTALRELMDKHLIKRKKIKNPQFGQQNHSNKYIWVYSLNANK